MKFSSNENSELIFFYKKKFFYDISQIIMYLLTRSAISEHNNNHP